MENQQNNMVELAKRIINDEKEIFNAHPEEKYRKEPIGQKEIFSKEDFIDFKVLNHKKTKQYKLKTYIEIPNLKTFPTPNTLIIMLHGMGSHSQPSAYIAKEFALLGCVTTAFDYRGHGYSEGKSGNIENMDDIIQDCKYFIEESEKFFRKTFLNSDNSAKIHKFLCGISMGGYLSYAISKEKESDFRGVIFFAPAFKIWANTVTKSLAKVLGSIIPNGFIPKINKESLVCKNPQFFEELDEVHSETNIRFKTMSELIKKEVLVINDAKNYTTPFVIISGGKDKLVKPVGHLEFFQNASTVDKQLWYYPNCWHFIYAEEEMLDILVKLKDWLKERIK